MLTASQIVRQKEMILDFFGVKQQEEVLEDVSYPGMSGTSLTNENSCYFLHLIYFHFLCRLHKTTDVGKARDENRRGRGQGEPDPGHESEQYSGGVPLSCDVVYSYTWPGHRVRDEGSV